MSLSLPSSVLDQIQDYKINRILFVQFPDPQGNTTHYWTNWVEDLDATIDGTTDTYTATDIRAPDIDRALDQELSDIRLRIANVDGNVADIITRNDGLFRNRVIVASFEKDNTGDEDVIMLDDWKVGKSSWSEVEAQVTIVPDTWLKSQQLTKTADRDLFPLAGNEEKYNFRQQPRTNPRTASSNK